MRSFGLIFGNTTHAIAAVLAVFMGGLALGSFLTTKLNFKRIMNAYALVEIGVGSSALLTIPLLHFLPEWYGLFLREHSLSHAAELTFRVFGAAIILLPPTILLGMTFPLLIEFLTRSGRSFYANMGFLYRTNTMGGAFGVLVATFCLMPSVGKLATYLIAAAANLTIGFLAWSWSKGLEENPNQGRRPRVAPQVKEASSAAPPNRRLHAIFLLTTFSTGLCSFGLEVLWTRSLSLVIGSSVYSFNIMLIALLLGIVSGTFVYEVCWKRIKRPLLWLSVFALAVGVLCLIDVAVTGFLPVLFFAMIKALPVSFFLSQATAFLLCFLTMFLVAVAFGFLFPLLTHFLNLRNYSAQRISGHLYFWNTLGTIMGSLGTGFFLVPLFGLQTSFVVLSILPLVLGIWLLGEALAWPPIRRIASFIVLITMAAALGKWYQPWDLIMMTAGIYKYGIEWRDGIQSAWSLPEQLKSTRNILFYKEGDEGVVCVTDTGNSRYISVNGKIDAGNNRADVATQKLIAHTPLMLHPNAQKALVIGWGSGSTAGTASLYPNLTQIDCVEIESLMYECGRYFTDTNHNVASDPRFRIHIQDARNYLLVAPTLYDVILSEPSNPWITGVSNLFTKDFYIIAKARLNEGGIFCQWFHFYDLTLRDIKSQARTFAESFPYASMWLVPPQTAEAGASSLSGDILLIGSDKPHHLDYEQVKRWYSNKAIHEDLVSLSGLEDELAFLCDYIMSRGDMLLFGSDAPCNTDNFPYIEFSAPKSLYQAKADAQRVEFGILQSLDNGSSEQFPPIENFPPLMEKNVSPKQHADLCVDIGTKYFSKAFLGRARRLFETAIKEDDKNADAYARLGELFYAQRLIDDTERTLLKAVALSSKLKKPYSILGAIYYSRNEFAKAEQMYKQLIYYFPDDPTGYYGRAVIYAEQRNWTQAREMVNQTLAIDPQMGNAIKLLDFLNKQIK